MVGISFIGTGFARKVQMPAFAGCSGARIVSVASAGLGNAESAAREFGAPHFTDDWRESIDRPDVDLVCITTPPVLHYEQTLFALERGKHVLCEKPMAMNASEAEAMCRAAESAGVLALIDHELRFQHGRKLAFELLRAGEIGPVRHVNYVFRNAQRGDPNVPWNWWSDEAAGGGALGAIGSHAVDGLLWLLGTDLESVFCQLQTHVRERRDAEGRLRPVTTDDEVTMAVRFADGPVTANATGTISLSMIEYPDYQHTIEFVGTLGSLRLLFLGEILVTKAGDSEWKEIPVTVGPGIEGLFDSGFPSGFVAFAERIVGAIAEGRSTVADAATFRDGLRIQRVLDAARESDRTGRVVRPR